MHPKVQSLNGRGFGLRHRLKFLRSHHMISLHHPSGHVTNSRGCLANLRNAAEQLMTDHG